MNLYQTVFFSSRVIILTQIMSHGNTCKKYSKSESNEKWVNKFLTIGPFLIEFNLQLKKLRQLWFIYKTKSVTWISVYIHMFSVFSYVQLRNFSVYSSINTKYIRFKDSAYDVVVYSSYIQCKSSCPIFKIQCLICKRPVEPSASKNCINVMNIPRQIILITFLKSLFLPWLYNHSK